MADESIISQQDIKDLVQSLINVAISDNENKFSWKDFYNKIDIFIEGFTLLKIELQKNNNQDTEILSLGTKLLFSFRQFLTGESLKFVIGGTATIHKEAALVEKEYDQNIIFALEKSKFMVNLNAQEIQLSHEIETLTSLKKDKKISNLNNYWKILLDAGFVTSKSEGVSDDNDMYRKIKKDNDVYFYFRNISKNKTLENLADSINEKTKNAIFYRYKNEASKAYNKGWLYQWLKMMEQKELEKITDTEAHPLALVISGTRRRERIEGITGGDYDNKQFKYYNNPTIITFNNILRITEKILIELKNIKIKDIPDSEAMKKLISLLLNEENKSLLENQLTSLAETFKLSTKI